MADKEKFLADTRDILRESTFRNEEWLNAFSQDLWYVKDYLRGYFAGESRPKGKWLIKRDCEEVIVTCSNCGAKDYIPTTIDGRFYFNRNYCWDCGADMRGEEQ